MFSFLIYVVWKSLQRIFLFFCLNIPIVLWVDYLCPFCHIQISYLSYFFCLTNIFRETELSHVCHISVDTAICHFRKMWTAPSHRRDRPQLLSAATAPRLCAVAAANAVAIDPQPPSTLPATVHICCAPLLPQLPLPSSKSALPQCNVCCSWYFNKNR